MEKMRRGTSELSEAKGEDIMFDYYVGDIFGEEDIVEPALSDWDVEWLSEFEEELSSLDEDYDSEDWFNGQN